MTIPNNEKLSIRTEAQEFLKLAVPLAGAQVAQLTTGFADTVIMGHLGNEILAAGGLASITFFSIMIATSGIVMGVTPLVATAYGAENKTDIEQFTRQGLWLSLLLSIPIMVATAHFDSLVSGLGLDETMLKSVKTYLDIMLWGLFPALGFAMLRGVVSALSQARPIFLIVTIGTGLNILGNYVLGFGALGFPRLELAGLALASTVTLWGMFVALIIYLSVSHHFESYKFFSSLYQLKPKKLWKLFKIGLPIGVFSTLEIGTYTVVSYLVAEFGANGLAAHQIVFQTINIIYMVPLGMSFAATARVGKWFGQNNMVGIRQAGLVGIVLGTLWTTVIVVVLLVFPQQIVGLYIDVLKPENEPIVSLAVSILRVGAIAHIFDGVQKIAYGALQGLQDTRVPMILSFLFYWCIGLTCGYWLAFGWNLDVIGLWLGLLIAVAVASVVFVWRFQALGMNNIRIKLNGN
ncbi:MATE family efflux transporter [Cyanobacterium aponinum UTEX 3222]|uniref:MATE family efflux transporter n=1 Tax=Cyanobacterium aponinum TaxID=379064 RepID=UPI00308C3747|nr:MATE family efflux transporter [Cyanobacterium aponinum UTEX 3222]